METRGYHWGTSDRHQARLRQYSRPHGRGHRARLQEHDHGGRSRDRGSVEIDSADHESDQIVARRTSLPHRDLTPWDLFHDLGENLICVDVFRFRLEV